MSDIQLLRLTNAVNSSRGRVHILLRFLRLPGPGPFVPKGEHAKQYLLFFRFLCFPSTFIQLGNEAPQLLHVGIEAGVAIKLCSVNSVCWWPHPDLNRDNRSKNPNRYQLRTWSLSGPGGARTRINLLNRQVLTQLSY